MTRALRTAPLLLLLLAACKKDGGTPAYVRITSPKVITATGHDTITSKITDLWVYVDDAPAGVWEVGSKVPLLGSGNSNVKLIAGIRRNGVTDDRIQYPFYATWSKQIDLVPEGTLELHPVLSYYPDLTYWIEDFSGGGVALDTIDCTAPLVRYNPTDSAYGGFVLDATHDVFRCTDSGNDLGIAYGTTAFLEMDYRSEVQLLIGVRYKIGDVQYQVPYLYVNPTTTVEGVRQWNKIYVDIGTALNVSGATDTRFYIEASLPSTSSSVHAEFDNLRVIH